MFNPKVALKRCKLAAHAYSSWDDCQAVVAEMGYPCFRSFESGENQAFVCANEGRIFVVFRGTDSVADWLKNVKFRKVPLDADRFPAMRVHRGFLLATAAIGEQVVAHVRSLLKRSSRPVEVVGHSLGAAMAEIWAFCSVKAGMDINQVWTFGAPRVGNRVWAKEYAWASLGSVTHRVTNNADVVPTVPRFNYHVGRHHHIDRHGRLREEISPLRYWLDRFLGWAWAWWRRGRKLDNIRDHFTGEYLEALEGLA